MHRHFSTRLLDEKIAAERADNDKNGKNVRREQRSTIDAKDDASILISIIL